MLQFVFEQRIEFCAVDALFERFVGDAIEIVVDHFVHEVALLEVALSQAGFDRVVAEGIERDRVSPPKRPAVGHSIFRAVLFFAESDRIERGLSHTVCSDAHFRIQAVLHLFYSRACAV